MNTHGLTNQVEGQNLSLHWQRTEDLQYMKPMFHQNFAKHWIYDADNHRHHLIQFEDVWVTKW